MFLNIRCLTIMIGIFFFRSGEQNGVEGFKVEESGMRFPSSQMVLEDYINRIVLQNCH